MTMSMIMSSEAVVADAAVSATAHLKSRTSLYATPPSPAIRLRVVLVAPRQVPVWLLRFFELVSQNPWLNLVVLPFSGEPAPSTFSLPWDLRALLAYERRHSLAGGMARAAIHEQDAVAFDTAIRSDLDTAVLRARIGLLRPDLILLLGAPQWAEALGDRAQWGCWDFGPSLTDAGCAAQALLAPVMRGEYATPVELRLQHLDRPPTSLVTSCGSTCRASASSQRDQALLKMPALLMRSLRQLAHAHGALDVPPQRTAHLQLTVAETSTASATRFGAGLSALARTLAFRFTVRCRRWSQPSETAWHLLMRHGREPINPDTPHVRQHAFLSAPGNQSWADPCVVNDGERRLLFVEQWTAEDPKGVIACLELLPNERVRPLGIALAQPFHLSYPQAFLWQGQWYLTVESGQARCVSLFRAETFPLRWQHITELIKGWNCVDPTLHHHDGHWYLFANVAESAGSSTWDELFLFVADSLTGPFRPHPANPIVSDARRARPAGRLFEREGRLIRPAQDCAPRYGAAVVFNEVLELSPTHYHERPLGRLDISWTLGVDGCHTYSGITGVEVLDARGAPPADSARLTVLDRLLPAAAIEIRR